METISKKQLVDQIAAKTDATKTDINTILDAYIDVVKSNVAEGNKVQLVGFGAFVTVLLVRVVTHKLVRKLKLLHQTFQHSSQVRASRMKLTSNNLLLQKKTASFLVVFYFASEPAINKTLPCSVSIISQSMPKFCLIACAVITSSGLPCF